MAVADDREPVSFTVVRHGFDRGQVRQRVAELAAAVEKSSSERDEALEQVAELHGELEIARREIAALTERLDSQGDEESATRLLAVAKSQAAEVTARARVAAEQTWKAAEQASSELRDHYRKLLMDLDKQHADLTQTHNSMMAKAKAQVDRMTTEAERRREAIDKDAEQDRVRIDREFSESMNAKREALRKEVESARARSTTEAARRVRDAKDEAEKRIAAATAEVDRLTALRTQLASQLRGSHQLLEEAADTIKPLDQEQDLSFEDTLLYPPALPYERSTPSPRPKNQ